MLRIHLMPRAHDGALKQRERRFHGVRVNVAVRVLASVVDRLALSAPNLVERRIAVPVCTNPFALLSEHHAG
jgi:hypothetical protein